MALDIRNQSETGRVSPETSLSKAMEQVRTWAAAAGLGLLVSMNPATANDTKSVQVADASGKVVPVSMTISPENAETIKASIIAEARGNGIDEDFDLPSLEAALDNMQKREGDLPVNEIELIIQYAPQSGQQIPVVLAYLEVNGDLDKVNKAYNAIKKAADTASGS